MIKEIFSKAPNNDTRVQFLRYTCVGGIAFALDLGVYAFAIYALGIHYLVAAALGFLLGLATNYALSVMWVFSDRKFDNRLLEFALFACIGGIGIGITEVLLYVLVDLLGAGYIFARLITTGVVYIWNFMARKWGLFNKSVTSHE